MNEQPENKIKKLIQELGIEEEISLEKVKEIILNEKDGSKEFNALTYKNS